MLGLSPEVNVIITCVAHATICLEPSQSPAVISLKRALFPERQRLIGLLSAVWACSKQQSGVNVSISQQYAHRSGTNERDARLGTREDSFKPEMQPGMDQDSISSPWESKHRLMLIVRYFSATEQPDDYKGSLWLSSPLGAAQLSSLCISQESLTLRYLCVQSTLAQLSL